ncbi:MAG: aminodeoxychorismate lyase [Burkholderiales bacterium]|nr:aminodeoxychorismate lyase [Burkholderiales bacterium]
MTVNTDRFGSLVDGEIASLVSVRDRGLAYGDGVFRTIACRAGRLEAWRRHMAKLAHDCSRLGLVCPDESLWLADIAELAPVDAVVKLMVTRGISQRGYACDPAAPVCRIVMTSPLPAYAAQAEHHAKRLHVCDWPLSLQAGLAGVKHLNRLDQVMARREWQDATIFDGLMCNARGEVVEGVISNLFIHDGNRWLTHPLADCGVAGVSRELVLAVLADMGQPAQLRAFSLEMLHAAQAVCVCNSLIGVAQVGQVGARIWGASAEVAMLRAAWMKQVNKESIAWCV